MHEIASVMGKCYRVGVKVGDVCFGGVRGSMTRPRLPFPPGLGSWGCISGRWLGRGRREFTGNFVGQLIATIPHAPRGSCSVSIMSMVVVTQTSLVVVILASNKDSLHTLPRPLPLVPRPLSQSRRKIDPHLGPPRPRAEHGKQPPRDAQHFGALLQSCIKSVS